jgi:Domain of unknown function (DUF4258)
MPPALQRIQQAFRNGVCWFSEHALEEMDADGLIEADVEQAVMNGSVVAVLTEDPRGTRFVVRGSGLDQQTKVEMVCRFLPSSTLRIITVYAIEE